MRLREAVVRGPFVISIGSAIAISATSLPAQTVVRASVSSAGVPADQASGNVTTSSDGFRLAFVSAASNLVPGDGNGKEDVFVRDLASGLTWRVSVDSSGAEANGRSLTACIAGNGGLVAFESDATNLVANDTNGVNDVFVHDLTTGVTSRVSVSTTGIEGNDQSSSPAISDDGSRIAFTSGATNFGAVGANNGVFLRDETSGQTSLVSLASHSIAVSPNPYYSLAISGDGRFVAYRIASPWSNSAVMLADTLTGTQTLVSGADNSRKPSISRDGRYVGFEHDGIVPGDSGWNFDVFVFDRLTGQVSCMSTDDAGDPVGNAYDAAVSPDGTRIAFSTASPNVVPGDTNLKSDVFVRTIVGRNVVRVSVVSPTLEGNGASTEPSLSDNASRVAFTSAATNFAFADTNSALDVFAADLCLASMVTYCTAGTTVHGCVPSITGEGAPSSIAASGFDIVVRDVPAQRYGTLFYGFYQLATPWATGSPSFKCIANPVTRTGVLDSGGVAGQCNGELRLDFNAWMRANPGALGSPFVAGQVFYAQGWFRDPAAPKQTNLSNGLRFTLCD